MSRSNSGANISTNCRRWQSTRITRPERYFLVAATGDEVLDWREMVAHYPAHGSVINGSDHGISDFERVSWMKCWRSAVSIPEQLPVMARSVAHAHWVAHVNGVNPSSADARLADRSRLADGELMARSSRISACSRLRQKRGDCAWQTSSGDRSNCRVVVGCGSVKCCCNAMAYRSCSRIPSCRWMRPHRTGRFSAPLGERSLGTTLFGDPQVMRGRIAICAPALATSAGATRVCSVLGVARRMARCYARRCLFRRKNGLLLVTEVFLPALPTSACGANLEK